ncbi:GPI inositol deacylase [Tulasnella sp. 331]|nr:GPI inositol deacylase [Tulasnella sp. 331]
MSQQPSGHPVLFIPGNAGSSQQIRSIASSVARQLYDHPYIPSANLRNGVIRPLDVFAAEFNEDLSALHGPTMISQKAYVTAAIDYILSLYPPGPNRPTQVLLIGHSMGGLVSISLLPSAKISGIITMSSPLSLPPARLDRRMEDLYINVFDSLYPPIHINATGSDVPILALCGGATDLQIPSESCNLPPPPLSSGLSAYRKVVFTSGMEGAWTGVGHNEMVWCHQVRWRVARAALELAGQPTVREREAVLNRWLTEGAMLDRDATKPESAWTSLQHLASENTILDLEALHEFRLPSQRFNRHLTNPDAHMYLYPISHPSENSRLTVVLARGLLVNISRDQPTSPNHFQVELFSCESHRGRSDIRCRVLADTDADLAPIPLPLPSVPFPAPKQGNKPEDVGLVFSTGVLGFKREGEAYIGIRVSGMMKAAHSGLVARVGSDDLSDTASMGLARVSTRSHSILEPYLYATDVSFKAKRLGSPHITPLVEVVHLPDIHVNALLAYSVKPRFAGSCSRTEGFMIPPMLHHVSSSSESQFHLLLSADPILLHSHSSGPFMDPVKPGMYIRVYSMSYVEGCSLSGLSIRVDWRASIGRWALRYWSSLVVWGISVASMGMAWSWFRWEQGGMSGGWIYAMLAPLCMSLATGFVGFTIIGLESVLWSIRLIARIRLPMSSTVIMPQLSANNISRGSNFRVTNLAAILALLLCVATLIPYQVAFVATWLILLWTCATASAPSAVSESERSTGDASDLVMDTTHIPLLSDPSKSDLQSRSRSRSSSPTEVPDEGVPQASSPSRPTSSSARAHVDTTNLAKHILLLQTLLVPLKAPILAVWIRTLASAGYTTPFDGDHNILMVLPWLGMMEVVTEGTPWRRVGRR